jgi:hypothetical protein
LPMERPSDFELVRVDLARRRELGEPFEAAWPQALAALPADLEERTTAIRVLRATEAVWAECYRTVCSAARHG